MTFIVGIAVSVIVYERTHRTTGSLVVPGYVGAQLLNPVALVATALNALTTWYLVARVLPRFAAVFGRTLFVVNIAVSVVLSMLTGPVLGPLLPAGVPRFDSIGYVIPALIAYDMNRHARDDGAQTKVLSDDFLDSFAILGSVEHCVDRLGPLIELGVSKFCISGASPVAADLEAVEASDRLITDVAPQFSSA